MIREVNRDNEVIMSQNSNLNSIREGSVETKLTPDLITAKGKTKNMLFSIEPVEEKHTLEAEEQV